MVFLFKCSDFLWEQKRHTAAVCIEQYALFLESKGERENMAKNTDIKFLEKLLADKETREITEDIVEIWENRNETLNDILWEHLKTVNFTEIDGTRAKKLNENVFIYFGLYENVFQIGFVNKKCEFTDDEITSLMNLLSQNEYSGYISDIEGGNEWIFGVYNKDKLLGTYESMFNNLSEIIISLEKKAGNLLKKE